MKHSSSFTMLSVRMVAILAGMAAAMFLVDIALARKDDGNVRKSRAQGSEFYFTPSSASLPDEENTSSSSVKIRTTSDEPFRVFTRQQAPSNNTVKSLRNNRNDTIPPLNTNTISLLPQCPSPYDIQRTDYVAGDTVMVYDTIFTCQPTPHEEYCNIPTLDDAYNNNVGISSNGGQQITVKSDEDVKDLWLNAWIESGQCEHYTSSPSNYPTISNAPTTSNVPTYVPSMSSIPSVSYMPTRLPTYTPTTNVPTYSPSSSYPTYSPSTASPTGLPTASSIPTNMPSFYPSGIPSVSPSNSPLAISPDAYSNNNNNNQQLNQNELQTSCNEPNQIHLRIEIQTDNYPTDTTWQFIDRTSNVILLSSPITGYTGETLGNGRMNAQYDERDICLGNTNNILDATEGEKIVQLTTKNTYEFALYDKYGDGLCCRVDDVSGYYKVMQKKKKEELDNDDNNDDGDENSWNVLVAASNFNAKEVHHYFELSTTATAIPSLEQSINDEPNTTNIPTPPPTTTAETNIELTCPYPQRKITIQLQTDNNGEEVSWELRVKNGPTLARNERTYVNNVIQTDVRDVCINDASLYELIIKDEYGDGLSRAVQSNNEQGGYYKIMTHHRMSDDNIESDDTTGETILHGGYFRKKKITHLINTTLPTLSDRDYEWLYEHNTRRKHWHAYYNTTYVPLQWSESLKEEAQVWATHLLDYCGSRMYHDPDRIYGENAAGNVGRDHWGEKRDPKQILARFVEYEVDWDWPENGHLTQTLWRASKYVGCAESHRAGRGTQNCHTQVCRYARTGNCNMAAFKRDDGTIDFVTAMLEDDNYCGPLCPQGGCHA